MTAGELIYSSLRLIGVIASGETPSAAEASDALAALNHLIDSWSNERLIVPSKTIESFSLTAGQASRTMGSSGNFNTTRPIRIESAAIRVSSTDYPMDVYHSAEEYNKIADKTTQSDVPKKLFVEYGYPLATLYFYGVPSAANSVVLHSWKPLSQLSTLVTAISLQPGAERALRFNLAVDLAPEYGKTVGQEIINGAQESKANIKRANIKTPLISASVDALPGAGFDIFKGE